MAQFRGTRSGMFTAMGRPKSHGRRQSALIREFEVPRLHERIIDLDRGPSRVFAKKLLQFRILRKHDSHLAIVRDCDFPCDGFGVLFAVERQLRLRLSEASLHEGSVANYQDGFSMIENGHPPNVAGFLEGPDSRALN